VIERAVEAPAGAGLEPRGPDMSARLAFVRETMGQPRIDVLRALFFDDEERAWDAARRFEDAFDPAAARVKI